MRKYVAAIGVVSLLAGCAVSIPSQQGQGGDSPPRGLVGPSPVTRALVDLSKRAKGKVLLHHVDDEGQTYRWTTRLKMGTSFRLDVDCVEASGTMIVRIGKSQLPHQCSARPGGVRFSTIPDKAAVRSIQVEAPKGAKWAILIWKPPQS
ncbi:hypothetical protein HII36_20910 [Nonomuraea sp. NN258]|uniref:hypothetical protein n=1 Tax=Nonomuraea antri TaxID=2730852 RepID=UPI001567D742|nr:hypothetical protein [Nonomuraea antri]NRQ34294.1 hypothetical protein [Nonomuraea antri]